MSGSVGTAGATHVRFLFGLPFGLVFLAIVLVTATEALPAPDLALVLWIGCGAVTQIIATALMLMAMHDRSFVVAIAYIKTEPVLVAIFGLIVLGDLLTVPIAIAIVTATAGVVAMSWTSGMAAWNPLRGASLGIAAGAFFAIAAAAYRGAILALGTPSFLLAATFTLAVGLAIQTALVSAWLGLFDRKAFAAILRAWKPSLSAGFLGALASQFWFLAFALAAAASVRTLALVEVLFAHFISRRLFAEGTTPREAARILLTVAGIILLLWTHR